MATIPLTTNVLQSLLDRHPDPITYHTPVFSSSGALTDFTLVFCNTCQRQQADLPVDEMIGQRVSELYGYSPEGRQLLLSQLTTVWTTGKDLETVYHNELLDVFFRVYRRKVEGGVLTVAKNINEEVRERHEKEHQIELSNQVLDTALNAWFTADVVQNEEGEITDFVFTRINPGFTRITGLLEADVLCKTYLSTFPSGKEQGSFDLNVRVFLSGKTERLEMPYNADGLNAWFEVAVSKLGQNSILVTFADITPQVQNLADLKHTNELLNGILANSASGIAYGQILRNEAGEIVDGRSILANDAAIRMAGIPRELFLSKTSVELEPNIRQSLYFQRMVHTMQTGEPSTVQYRVESSGKWIEIALARMDDDHLIIVYSDITENKEAQLRQDHLLDELRRSNENLEDFTSAASHDLKEPIRKVQFFTSQLKEKLEGRLSGNEERLIERVENGSLRMKRLVDDLLEYAHASKGDQPLEEVNLAEKVSLVLTDLELTITEKNAVVNVGPLPIVRGYKLQLQQLLLNVLSNALKYHKPGEPPLVHVSSRIVTGADAGLRVAAEDMARPFHLIEVADEGIGLDPHYAERIFGMFTRLHGNAEYTGTGVGLAIVKKVVENHRGYVNVLSEPGKGATFNVLLPVHPDVPAR